MQRDTVNLKETNNFDICILLKKLTAQWGKLEEDFENENQAGNQVKIAGKNGQELELMTLALHYGTSNILKFQKKFYN